jgi:hypothetical protein
MSDPRGQQHPGQRRREDTNDLLARLARHVSGNVSLLW